MDARVDTRGAQVGMRRGEERVYLGEWRGVGGVYVLGGGLSPGMTKCCSCSCCNVEMPRMCWPCCMRYFCLSCSLSSLLLSLVGVYVGPDSCFLLLLSNRSLGLLLPDADVDTPSDVPSFAALPSLSAAKQPPKHCI
jgi:hypothetical protein